MTDETEITFETEASIMSYGFIVKYVHKCPYEEHRTYQIQIGKTTYHGCKIITNDTTRKIATISFETATHTMHDNIPGWGLMLT